MGFPNRALSPARINLYISSCIAHRPIAIHHICRALFFAPQIHEIHHKVRPDSVELLRRDYTANGGWETFLSYEDPEKDILVGLLRLRKCSEEGTFRPELVRKDGDEGGCSIVRELHVYGTAVPVHGRDPSKFQHQVSLIDIYILGLAVLSA